MNNNLALSDYVNLDDKRARNTSIIKMVIAFIVLMAAYLAIPFLQYVIKSVPILLITYLVLAIIVAYIAYRLADTTKVTKKQIKLGKVTLIIFIIFIVLWQLVLLFNKVSIFKLSEMKLIDVLAQAIFAGIIEEALFRGLLLNVFIDVFYSKKYMFIWAAVLESLCFALFHFLDLAHQSFASTLGQVIIVLGSGLIMTYMRFAINGIWLATIYHIYSDISPQLASSNFGNSDVIGEFIFMIVIAVIGLSCIYSYNKRYNDGILR